MITRPAMEMWKGLVSEKAEERSSKPQRRPNSGPQARGRLVYTEETTEAISRELRRAVKGVW